MKDINNIKTKSDVAENLKDIYYAIKKLPIQMTNLSEDIYLEEKDKDLSEDKEFIELDEISKELLRTVSNIHTSPEDIKSYDAKLKQTIKTVFGEMEVERQITILKELIDIEFIRLDEMYIGSNNKVLSSIDFLKRYYSEILKRSEDLKKEQVSQQLHINKIKETGYSYGDFSEFKSHTNISKTSSNAIKRGVSNNFLKKPLNVANEKTKDKNVETNMPIFDGDNEILYDTETVKVIINRSYMTKKMNKKTLEVSPEIIRKYYVKVTQEDGKKVVITFFAEQQLEEDIQSMGNKAINLIALAVCKAKERGRQFIGRITCLPNRIDEFLTTYDDKLEEAIQRILQMNKNNKNNTNNENLLHLQQKNEERDN